MHRVVSLWQSMPKIFLCMFKIHLMPELGFVMKRRLGF